MGNMETLRAAVEDWHDPDGEDLFCSEVPECTVECKLCGNLEPEDKTINYCGDIICFDCAERILELYGEAR